MASEGNSATVAIFAIVIIAMLGAFIAWRMGAFGGGNDHHKVDIELKSPAK